MPHDFVPCSKCGSTAINFISMLKGNNFRVVCQNTHGISYPQNNLTNGAKQRFHSFVSCSELELGCKDAIYGYQKIKNICEEAFWKKVGQQQLSCSCSDTNHDPSSANFLEKKSDKPQALLRVNYKKSNCGKHNTHDVYIGALPDEDKKRLHGLIPCHELELKNCGELGLTSQCTQ